MSVLSYIVGNVSLTSFYFNPRKVLKVTEMVI